MTLLFGTNPDYEHQAIKEARRNLVKKSSLIIYNAFAQYKTNVQKFLEIQKLHYHKPARLINWDSGCGHNFHDRRLRKEL